MKYLVALAAIGLVVALTLPAPQPPPVAAQNADCFLAVQNWTGTFTVSVSGTQNSSSSAGAMQMQQTVTVSGTTGGSFQLRQIEDMPGHYEGPQQASGSITITEIGRSNGPGLTTVNESVISGSGSHDGADGQYVAGLIIKPDTGTYWVSVAGLNINDATRRITGSGSTAAGPLLPENKTISPYSAGTPAGAVELPLPACGSSLRGSTTIPKAYGAGSFEFDVTFEWNIQPAGPTEDLELIVEPEQYDTWIPEGTFDENTPGNAIRINARLARRGGGVPSDRIRVLRFELIETSVEPGVAINYPPEAGVVPNVPDLQFDRRPDNDPVIRIISADGQQAEIRGDMLTGSAKVAAHDYGAFGTLRVTAELASGRQLTSQPLLLPKRSNGSRIADAWKSQMRTTAADDADDEVARVGGAVIGHAEHPGDGLTLYEEYRGFYSGDHQRGRPDRKEFFVNDSISSGQTTNGIAIFSTLTNYRVIRVSDAEIGESPKRLINFNVGDVPNHVYQHGIRIERGTGGRGRDSSKYHPAFRLVVLNHSPTVWDDARNGEARVITNEYAATVAHELLHAANVVHHGSMDVEQEWEIAGGVFTERGSPIRFVAEGSGREIRPSEPVTAWIGLEGGQHSGVEECVMRYNCALAYDPRDGVAPADVRYAVLERSGIGLCDSRTGTGVNAAGRSPQPRYGNATVGECRGQVCMNARYH